jgi:outer membrane protein TolC
VGIEEERFLMGNKAALILLVSALCLVGLFSWLAPRAGNPPVHPAIVATPPLANPAWQEPQAAEPPISPSPPPSLKSEQGLGAIPPKESASARPSVAATEAPRAPEAPPQTGPAAPETSVPVPEIPAPAPEIEAAAPPEKAEPLPEFNLQYFEDRLDESPHVAAADAEHAAQEREASRIDNENGLKAVASANAGRTSDPYVGAYNTGILLGGLSYPILGTRAREKATLETAKAQAHSLHGRAELARREELRDLRRSYVQYWIGARQIEAARAFLSAEADVRQLLDRRRAAGMLRESRRLDLLTAFDAARSDLAAFTAARALALMTLNRVAGSALREFHPLPPALPPDWPDQGAVLQRVAGHPELEALRALLADRHDLLAYAANRYPESDILLSVSGIADSPGGPGGSALLGVEFRVPIGVIAAQRESKAAARLSLIQYERQLEDRTQLLQGQAVEAFGLVEAKNAGLALARRRLAAAEQALREDFTRANMAVPDSLESLLQSRRDYYRASMDCLTAEMDGLMTRVMLLALTGDPEAAPQERPRAPRSALAEDSISPRLLGAELIAGVREGATATETLEKAASLFAAPPPAETAAIPLAASEPAAEGIAVYMWATQAWLNRTRQLQARGQRLPSADDYEKDPMWGELARREVRTVLLSLDGAQINEIAGEAQAFTHLLRLIGAAHEHGCRIELLLGEPTWILAAHRQDLLDIIGKLRDLPFDGLHLDLEPSQLKPEKEDRTAILSSLVETARAVKDVSPWKVTLTLHPRDLGAPAGAGGESLGLALDKAGIRHVALMIYASRVDRIRERAIALMQANPGLRVSVVVSVEPVQAVGAEVTLASEGAGKFYESARALDEALRACPNYGGLEVQDWRSLKELKP